MSHLAAIRAVLFAGLLALLSAFALAGCSGYESEYEKGVYHLEPIYCYQTIGSVDCHRKPAARDADRLVNYYGPAPSKYDPPKPPHLNKLRAPPEGQGYWREPEPVPGPPEDEDAEEGDAQEDADGGPGTDCEQPSSCPPPESSPPASQASPPSPPASPPAPAPVPAPAHAAELPAAI